MAEAEAILAGERDCGVVTYGISDELAGTVGLTCGGTVHIFIQQLAGAAGEIELAALGEHLAGRPAAVATLLDGPSAGARLGIVDYEATGLLGLSP